ncbi:MAG: HepT-like ribonuclease domain-containing protein [bacterium]
MKSLKIKIFKDALAKLKIIRDAGREKFSNDWQIQDSALRNFQIAIESLADRGVAI